MSEKSNTELIKEFMETCPLLKGGKVNVDYIEDKIDRYSIDETPNTTVIQKFTDGGSRRQITFNFSISAPFDVLENIKNSKFCDDIMEWVEIQDFNRNYPKIEGAESITCNRGTILQTTETNAIYVMPINFIYVKEAY